MAISVTPYCKRLTFEEQPESVQRYSKSHTAENVAEGKAVMYGLFIGDKMVSSLYAFFSPELISSNTSLLFPTEGSVHLSNLYTEPSYRHKGYIKQLFNYISTDLHKQYDCITLCVDPKYPVLIGVYARYGFNHFEGLLEQSRADVEYVLVYSKEV